MVLNCVVLGTRAPHEGAFVYRGMSLCYEHLLKANREEFSTGGGPSRAWPNMDKVIQHIIDSEGE